jgi:hypothetical protein
MLVAGPTASNAIGDVSGMQEMHDLHVVMSFVHCTNARRGHVTAVTATHVAVPHGTRSPARA